MKRHPSSRMSALLAGSLAALLLFSMAAPTDASQLTDDFSAVFDYSGGTVDGIWTGSYNMPNLAGGLFGSNFFGNGELYVDDNGVTNVGWEGGRSTAPFLFTDVAGDQGFQATVKITSQTSGFWSAAGLIARAKQGTPPGTGADNADEHFATFYSFRTNADIPDVGTTLMKRIENGAQLDDIQINVDVQSVPNPNYDPNDPNSMEFIDVSLNPTPFWLRLERLRINNTGPIVYQGSVSSDGTNWQVQSMVTPTAGSPLVSTESDIEVGLSYMNFGSLAGSSTFDDFVLEHTGIIPEPASVSLLLVAGLFGACRLLRRRR